MPDRTRANCQNCGKHKSVAGPISWGGYCSECSAFLYHFNMDGLHTKSGAAWERYRIGVTTAALGREVTAALFKAGIFSRSLDEPATGR
jgi:hypothetical protein